jgi:hypothetical protein
MSDAAASLESVEILPAISDLGFQIIVAVVFVIPGLNTTWLIERLVGRTTPRGSSVFYGLFHGACSSTSC